MSDVSPAPAAPPLPPHPVLPAYFADAGAKRPFLREIFDATAADYDGVERVLALGSGRWYRRRALTRAGLALGARVLDVATGTGLVAREAAFIVGPGGLVVGVDPSIGMLLEARRTLALPCVLGVGESLPVADASFHFVSMGYALRHLPDLRATFAEFARVLAPGGRVCVLEISRPRGRLGRALMAAYFKALLPAMSRVIGTGARTRELWKYYWETIDACVEPEAVLGVMRDAGLNDAARHVELGIFSAFTATKPPGAAASA